MQIRSCSARALATASLVLASSGGLAHAGDAPPVELYGFIKVGPIIGDNVESYGNANAVAATAGNNPVFQHGDRNNQFTTFQAAQTRFGLRTKQDLAVTGTVELDFVDFGKSSPEWGLNPRLRRAAVDWKVNKDITLTAGQDWDLYAPMVPHHYNWVGANFFAGNIAFLRQQVQYKHRVGPMEIAAAVGLAGNNNGASFADVEWNGLPTFAGRVTFDLKELGKVGINAIGTNLHFMGSGTVPSRDGWTYAFGAWADLWLGKKLNLRVEGNYGQNINNTGMLSLSNGTAKGGDVQEAGGYISAKQWFGAFAAWVSVGVAHVLNPENVLIGYTPASSATQTSPAVAAVRAVTTNGPGILRNTSAHVGFEYKPLEKLSVFVDGTFFNTQFKLADADAVKLGTGSIGWTCEVGMLYFF